LNELWPRDEAARELLQEWFGYCLLPDLSQQKILAIVGPPRSGKSTVARVLRELVGPSNVACPSIRSLSGQFGLWALLDRLVAIIPDATLPYPCPALEELLKAISGEDAVDIHRKGMAPLTGVRLPTRFVILANEMPSFRDPSGALDQRLLVLRTTTSFCGIEDIGMTDKLVTELPGILNWAVKGRQRLRLRGRFEYSRGLSQVSPRTSICEDAEPISRVVIEFGDPTPRYGRRRRKDRGCARAR
jgi:putative DNA primase/helicase